MDFVWESPTIDAVSVQWKSHLTCCDLSAEKHFVFQGLKPAKHGTRSDVMVVEFCCTVQ